MIRALLLLVLITFIPALELRASIPLGVFEPNLRAVFTWPVVLAICVAANAVLGWLVYEIMGPFFSLLRRWRWFDTRVWPRLERTRHKVHPYVEKYGTMGLAIFIGVPLPGSGVYTGAFGAYLLGMDRRRFALANLVGVVIAGIAVILVCLLIRDGVLSADSPLVRLLIKPPEHP